MKKAFNVYKTYGNSGISVAFRKFTLLLAFGVCVFGFQSEAVAQTFTSTAPGADPTQSPLENASFLQNFIITSSASESATILRDQIKFLLDSGDEPDSGIAELDYGVRMTFLENSVNNLMTESPTEVYLALSKAFTITDQRYSEVRQKVDVQGIVESYARLLE